jgi:SAM-dependent methyltransferase
MTLLETLRRLVKSTPKPVVAPTSPGAVGKFTDEESLGRELLQLDSGLGLFRWAHLADALERCPATVRVLSVGSGGSLHEAFLARTRPTLEVTGVDLREPWVARDLPNLHFLRGDLLDPDFRATLPRADFIFSIECLEHIEDDRTVARAMADLLAPGGSLYLQLPFASPSEQSDSALCETERRNHGHVRPGYDPTSIRTLIEGVGLEVDLIACAFWFPLQPMVWAALEKFRPILIPRWREVLALISDDVREGIASDRTQATAIKLLARKNLG